jgi:hypothetical protein
MLEEETVAENKPFDADLYLKETYWYHNLFTLCHMNYVAEKSRIILFNS